MHKAYFALSNLSTEVYRLSRYQVRLNIPAFGRIGSGVDRRLKKAYARAEPLFRRGLAIAERIYHMPYTKMTDRALYNVPRREEMVGPLFDGYCWLLRDTGRTAEARAMWERMQD
ncbi:MAG TPA: hypothetical protein VGM23_02890 [Armatimonadota bacterium]|jgi:hypothetical protein